MGIKLASAKSKRNLFKAWTQHKKLGLIDLTDATLVWGSSRVETWMQQLKKQTWKHNELKKKYILELGHETMACAVCLLIFLWPSGPQFNIKMTSYQYRKSHCGDKTILRPSYLHNGISYTGKMTSLYWIRALVFVFNTPYQSPSDMHWLDMDIERLIWNCWNIELPAFMRYENLLWCTSQYGLFFLWVVNIFLVFFLMHIHNLYSCKHVTMCHPILPAWGAPWPSFGHLRHGNKDGRCLLLININCTYAARNTNQGTVPATG